jgi:hypothetical protein
MRGGEYVDLSEGGIDQRENADPFDVAKFKSDTCLQKAFSFFEPFRAR